MNTGIQDAHNLAWKLAAGIFGHLSSTCTTAALLQACRPYPCRVRLSVHGGTQ